jgi:hypothetical protein
MQVILRSQLRNVFLTKLLGPLLCVGGSLLVFGEDFPSKRFLLAIPFLVAAFFGVSLAIVEVRGGGLRYRRLFKWTTIPEDQIAWARVEWPPVIGSVSLKRFLFPWGRLYFILDKSTESSPFRRGEFPLVHYLNREEPHKEGESSPLSPEARFSNLRLYWAAGIGIFTCLMIFYLTPQDLLQDGVPKSTADMPTLLKTLFQFVRWFHLSAVQIISTAVMALLAVSRRNKPEAWLYAFLSGFALAVIVGRLLS